jgi:hypothetical protein
MRLARTLLLLARFGREGGYVSGKLKFGVQKAGGW